MSQSFTCPNCSAPLDYDGNDLTVRCPYCSSSVIVPETLRSQPPATAFRSASLPVQGLDSTLAQAGRLRDIVHLIRTGNKVEAIRVYGEVMGVGLTEAKDAVDKLAAGQPVVMRSSSSSFMAAPAAPTYQPIPTYTSYSTPVTTVTTAGRATAGSLACGGLFAVFMVVVVAVIGIIAAGASFGFNLSDIPGISNLPIISQFVFATRTLSFGNGEGDGPGFFQDTRAIAVDGEGNIYTGDYDTRRIQVFDSQGNFVNQWKLQGDQPYLSGLAATRDGVLYALVSGSLHKYDAKTGELLGTLSTGDSFDSLDDVAVTADGGVVAASSDGVYWFDSDGRLVQSTSQTLREIFFGDDQTESVATVNSIAVDGSGNVYLAIFPQYFIFKLSPEGALVDRFGGEGEGNGRFRTWPDAVAIDGQGRLYAADFKGIQVFDASGSYVATVSSAGYTPDMVFNLQNELLVMDRNANKVYKYTLNTQGE
ncbi:MAG TPA: hypothetical protein VI547_08265 [Anaerolineales bacterium]|nr:hypothetical protein [Anaerolineales bacterium]